MKETMEVLEGLEVIAVAVGEALEDGKIDFKDVTIIPEVAMKFDTLNEAIKDVELSLEEVKGMKEEDVLAVISKVYAIVKAFEEAKKAK